LWYASRATGVVSLVLLSGVAILGILVNRRGRLPGLPRFAVSSLHRNLSMLTVLFLGAHIVTAIADGYAPIPWLSGIVPFSSGYERFWLGLGTVALDLVAAVIITSLLRDRLPRSIWRAVHLMTYAAYPMTVVHGIGISKDLRSGGLLALTLASVLAVGAAVGYRVSEGLVAVPRPRRVPQQLEWATRTASTAPRTRSPR
jgi:predicted ferric reductase